MQRGCSAAAVAGAAVQALRMGLPEVAETGDPV